MTYYISDLHFGHTNILSFDNRPFKTIEDHDNALIHNWNEKVGIGDEVYILGDVSWLNVTTTIDILKHLNGSKHLIIGNHDKKLVKNPDFRNMFVEVTNYKEIESDDGKGIVLCHYPIPCYNNHFRGWYHLYGHVHSTFEENITQRFKYEMTELYGHKSNMYNVGAMMPYIGYTPRTLTEIIERINDVSQ